MADTSAFSFAPPRRIARRASSPRARADGAYGLERFCRLAVVLGVALVLHAPGLSRAQTDGDPVVAAEGAEDLDLTRESIRQRLDQVRNGNTVTGEQRARAIASYEMALQELDTADALMRKARAFEQSRIDAPRTLSELERELAQSPSEPDIERNVSADALEDQLKRVEADLAASRSTLKKVEGEQDKRSRRRLEAPRQAADLTQEIAEIDAKLRSRTPPTEDEALLAEKAALSARQHALRATLDATEKELASYEARRDLLAAKRDQTLRRIARLMDRAKMLQERVAAARQAEAEEDSKQAMEDQREVAGVHPALRSIAERNAELARLRSGAEGLPTRIEAAHAGLAYAGAELERIAARFATMRERAEAVGFTPAVGLLLRKERAELPSVTARLRASRERQGDIGAVQLELIELEEERDQLADVDALVEAVVAQVAGSVDAPETLRVGKAARELYLTQRAYLDSVIREYDDYFTTLVELDARERDLIESVRDYGLYIDENVLWIRGTSIGGGRIALGVAGAVAWLTRPAHLARLVDGVAAAFTERLVLSGSLLLGWLLLLLYRRRIEARLAALCPSRAKALSMSMQQTVEAVGLVVLLSAVWPALVYVVAFLVVGVEGASGEFGHAVGAGLSAVASVLLVTEVVRTLCKAGGPGEMHFGWSAARMRTLRRGIASAGVVVFPAIFVIVTLDAQPNELFAGSLGRIVLLAALGWGTFVSYRTLHPRAGVLEEIERRAGGPWSRQVAHRLHVLAAVIPGVLFLMAATGYDFAAADLAVRLGRTAVLVLVVILGHALAQRWLTLTRRRLAVRQASERRAARQQAEEKQGDGDIVAVTEGDSLDLGVVNAQTRRLVRAVVAVSLLIGGFVIWYDVLPALRVLERVELWSVTRETTEVIHGENGDETRKLAERIPITAANLFKSAFILLLTSVAGRNIPGFLEMTVLQQLPLDAGLRYAITSVSRYLIGVLGMVLAVGAIGVNWSSVQWLVAAMTVGLGFGLQEIFANFIAGLIVLFERPIRVGDMVTLGTVSGTVTKIRMRATTIVDWDRKELIVPNKEFITGQLINWTLSDQTLRLVIPVGVAYGSDTELVEKLLLEVARSYEHVVGDPPPTVMFNAFGESSLDFQLRVFIGQFDHLWRTRHALCMAIDKAFRTAGVEISFPQRDLHLRSIASPIEISLRSDAGAAATQSPASDRPD